MIKSDRLVKTISTGKKLNRLFVGAIVFVEILVIVTLTTIFLKIWHCRPLDNSITASAASMKDFYNLLALALIFIWFGIVVAYYAWAIYFYNINLGLTNEEWQEVRERYGYIPENAEDVRTENPHMTQTLGLPPGTIRGTLALTLLVGGLSMAIASLGLDTTLKANSFLVDNFDFFKTAFLMMIAFYFGNKALEKIGYKSQRIYGAPGSGDQGADSKPENNPTTPASKPGSSSAPASPASQQARKIQAALSEPEKKPTEQNEGSKDSDFENPQAVQ